MVNEVLEPGALMPRAYALARQLAALPTLTLRYMRISAGGAEGLQKKLATLRDLAGRIERQLRAADKAPAVPPIPNRRA